MIYTIQKTAHLLDQHKMTIDATTKFPLFVAIGAMPTIIVAVMWLGATAERVTANEKRADLALDRISRLEEKGDQVLDGIIDLKERLARIEERLKHRGN